MLEGAEALLAPHKYALDLNHCFPKVCRDNVKLVSRKLKFFIFKYLLIIDLSQ